MKVLLSVEELETVENEIYEEGFKDGYDTAFKNFYAPVALEMPDRSGVQGELRIMASALERARTVLGNMALENEGAIFNRWPINHEPLRADAKGLLPIIDEAIRTYEENSQPAPDHEELKRAVAALDGPPHYML